MRLAIPLAIVLLLLPAPTATGQNDTPEGNETPPGLEESVEDDIDETAQGDVWSWFTLLVGLAMGILLVLVLRKRPERPGP